MHSIQELYRIGTGPSSSHTMAPRKAARFFLERFPQAKRYRVTLYGTLSATGRGPLTDQAIEQTLSPRSGGRETGSRPPERDAFRGDGGGRNTRRTVDGLQCRRRSVARRRRGFPV